MDKRFGHRIYEFGEYRLDARHLMLSQRGEETSLAPKAVETLVALIERGGQIVHKDELLDAVWPDTAVEESNLFLYLSQLRKALGTQPSGKPWIETLRRRGYRFNGEVRVLETEAAALAVPVGDAGSATKAEGLVAPPDRDSEASQPDKLAPFVSAAVTLSDAVPSAHSSLQETKLNEVTAEGSRENERGESFRRRYLLAILLGTVLLTAAAGGVFYWRGARPASTAEQRVKTLAILPFKPLTEGERDEQLEIGMADTLITRLGSNNSIVVRSIGSVLKYKNAETDPIKAGENLQVESVLVGSLQRSGDVIRVNVRLLRVADGSVMWSDTFDEKFTSIFNVQSAIASMIATALDSHLAGEKRYTTSTEAYEYFIRGRYHQYRITAESFRKSIGFYEQAVSIDPNYALAFAYMGSAYRSSASAGFVPAKEALPQAKALAEKARELDPSLAEPYAVLGWYYFIYSWDWRTSESYFRRAIELDRNNSEVRIGFASLLSFTKRHEEAVDEARRARELSPTTPIVLALESQILLNAGYAEEAMNRAIKALDFEPNFWPARLHLAEAYRVQRRYAEAEAEYEKARAAAPEGYGHMTRIAKLYIDTGDRERLASFLKSLENEAKVKSIPFFTLAKIHNGLGHYDEALDQLENSLEARESHLVGIITDTQFANLRSQPRFQEILRKMNWNPYNLTGVTAE